MRYAETSDALLERLGTPTDEVAAELLSEAEAAFDEVAGRAESAERRAATVQGAIAIAASLTLAGGSLLLDTSKVPSRGWRIVFAVGLALVVLCFVVAAWRSVLVTWPRFMWASPAARDIADVHAREGSIGSIRVQRTRDLLIAYGRNDSIARLKITLLGSAFRWMLAALALLAVLAALFATYSIERSSRGLSTATAKPATTRTGSAQSASAPASGAPRHHRHGLPIRRPRRGHKRCVAGRAERPTPRIRHKRGRREERACGVGGRANAACGCRMR